MSIQGKDVAAWLVRRLERGTVIMAGGDWRSYLADGTRECPHCESTILMRHLRCEPGAWKLMECVACGASWDENEEVPW